MGCWGTFNFLVRHIGRRHSPAFFYFILKYFTSFFFFPPLISGGNFVPGEIDRTGRGRGSDIDDQMRHLSSVGGIF